MSHCSEGEKGCTPKRSHNANGSKTVAGKNIGKTDGALPCSGRREESSGKACFPPVLPMRSSYATSMLGHAKKHEPNRSPFAVRFRPHQQNPRRPTRRQAPHTPGRKSRPRPPTREPGPRHESGAPQTSPAFPNKPSTFGARSSLLPPKDAKPHLALAIGLFRGIPLLPGLLDREPTDGKERTAWCGESRRPAHFLAKITVETSLAIGRIGSPGFHVAVDVMPRSGI